jgi:hypothetical protein
MRKVGSEILCRLNRYIRSPSSYGIVTNLNKSETYNTDGAVPFIRTLLTWILSGFSSYVFQNPDKHGLPQQRFYVPEA